MGEKEFTKEFTAERTLKRTTIEGSKAINEELQRRYRAIQAKTAKERFDYLKGKGWTRLSMERRGEHVVVMWQAPADFPDDLIWHTQLNQTKSMLAQLYKDMRDENFCE